MVSMMSMKSASVLMAVSLFTGAFIASSELRAFAANTIGSIDIIDESILSVDIKNGEVKGPDIAGNAVTTGKIKDGEVKLADIGPDAVGGSEIVGVNKLLFSECLFTDNTLRPPEDWYHAECAIPGMAAGDEVVVSRATEEDCFDINGFDPKDGKVIIKGRNDCAVPAAVGTTRFSIIVFH
ncbi:MAG TPA: hypothetical protein VJL54_01910 [Nitrososphaera sp.]|nr:hypothetical protein [Nitrososphaera sp.]